MKRWIILIALALAATAGAVHIPKWITVTDTTGIRKTYQDQYIYNGRHYVGMNGYLLELATSALGFTVAGKINADYAENATATDGTRYYDFRTDVNVAQAAASDGLATLYGRINWVHGGNSNALLHGVEGAASSSAADESITLRGGYFRTYTQANADAAGSTARTSIGSEMSVRAGYAGGNAVQPESGTAFVGARIWMAPYFATSIANINNFHGLWLYNEHPTYDVTNGIYINSASGGGSWTNFLNFRNAADVSMFNVSKIGKVTTPDTVVALALRTNVITPGSASSLTIGRVSGKTTILDTTVATLALRTNLIKAGSASDLVIDDNTTFGSTTAGANLTVAATEEASIAPTFAAANWTATNGWSADGVGTQLTKVTNAAIGTITPSGAGATPTGGVTYKIVITASATSGAITYTYGGVAGTAITATTITDNITAITVDKLIISGAISSTATITAVSIQKYTDATGDLAVAGNLKLSSPIQNAKGQDAITVLPTGNVYFPTNVGIGTTGPGNQLTQKTTTALESATLGSELLTSSNWTATDWTGDFATGFAHTTGNITALTNTLAAVTNNLYQIAFTVTGRTAGSFTIIFGGLTSGGYSATNAWGPKAISTGALSITPTTDFNGTIVISIKQITGVSSATYAIQDNTEVNAFEIRNTLNTLNNQFVGKNAGRYNTTGTYNTANGVNSLYSNTTGYQNTANGFNSLYSNTTGYYNTANGVNSLYSNTTGYYNTANGFYSLYSNTTGSQNTANGYASLYSNTTGTNNTANGVNSLYSNTTGYQNTANGVQSLYSNTTGYNNTANGVYSLYSNTTGYNNTANGFYSGRYIADGTTGRTTGNNGLYLGYSSKASADGTDNEIVIGYNAIGNGSNSVTLGNTSVTKTVLNGNVGIGTPTPYHLGSFVGKLAAINITNPNINITRTDSTTASDSASVKWGIIAGVPGGVVKSNTGLTAFSVIGMDATVGGNLNVQATANNHDIYVGTTPYSYMDAGDASWTILSDASLKDNIAPVSVDNILDRVGNLQPIKYNFKKSAYLRDVPTKEFMARLDSVGIVSRMSRAQKQSQGTFTTSTKLDTVGKDSTTGKPITKEVEVEKFYITKAKLNTIKGTFIAQDSLAWLRDQQKRADDQSKKPHYGFTAQNFNGSLFDNPEKMEINNNEAEAVQWQALIELTALVKTQQSTIDDLVKRVEVLEKR